MTKKVTKYKLAMQETIFNLEKSLKFKHKNTDILTIRQLEALQDNLWHIFNAKQYKLNRKIFY